MHPSALKAQIRLFNDAIVGSTTMNVLHYAGTQAEDDVRMGLCVISHTFNFPGLMVEVSQGEGQELTMWSQRRPSLALEWRPARGCP